MDENDEKKIKIMAYLDVFGSENGKIVKNDIDTLSGYHISRIPRGLDGHIDPLEMARQIGQRSVSVHIETMLKKDPNEKKGIRNVEVQ